VQSIKGDKGSRLGLSFLKGLRCAAPAFAPTPPPPAGVRSGCLASGLHSWHVPQAGARGAKAALLSPAAVCGERVPVQAQSPACPLGAERMKSSIQFALGWSRGRQFPLRGLTQILDPALQRIRADCCRSSARLLQAGVSIPLPPA